MSWQCIELTLPAEKECLYAKLFDEFGALSVTTTAADDSVIFEVAGKGSGSWQRIKLSGMFDSHANLAALFDKLADDKDLVVKEKRLKDRDWEKTWLDNFKPRKINEKLWICPGWVQPVDPTAVTVRIDPGMSFGTGTHQSTRLCLQWISELNLENSTVIDYGCGSGILAVAAIKLGAQSALAIDIDPRCLSDSRKNASMNNACHALTVCLPAEMPEIKSDLVIANILAGTIINLSHVLSGCTKPHGQLLLAGILAAQQQSIADAFIDFEWQARSDGDWVAMLGNRTQ